MTPYLVTIRLGGMLGIGWRDLADTLVVRAALEDAAGGRQGPLDELIRSGRVVELPDGEPAMVMQATGKLARIRFGLPVANGQKTTLSRRPARSERAKLGTSEVFCLEAVLAVGVDVLVPAWRQMSQVGLLYRVALDA